MSEQQSFVINFKDGTSQAEIDAYKKKIVEQGGEITKDLSSPLLGTNAIAVTLPASAQGLQSQSFQNDEVVEHFELDQPFSTQ